MTSKMNLRSNEKENHSHDPDEDDVQKLFFRSRSSHLKVNNKNNIMKWGRLVLVSFLSLVVGFMLATEFSPTNNDTTTTAFHSKFNTIRGDSSYDKDTREGHWPRIAWLMTFPNSGTTFTQSMIRSVSQRDTGTNYKKEGGLDDAKPIYAESPNGPFWATSWNVTSEHTLETPTSYVLTKTHCGGRCGTCRLPQYVENPHSFLLRCRSSTKTDHHYDASLVHKSVHLIRNPFDNIVSRFHHTRKQYVKNNETEKLNLFTYSKEGFRNYCSMVNDEFGEIDKEIKRFTGPNILDAMKSIPCYQDFFRYAQWHNLAFVTTDDLGIPTHLLHYEDYEENFDETVNNLLKFLDLEWRGDNIEFIKGKKYSTYFTLKERKTVASLMKELSSVKTWNNIEHYFTFPATI